MLFLETDMLFMILTILDKILELRYL